mmetsp:Transcript_2616/g.4829  ORF Transcript_2616/g.4829 Transcript_2616/m.4829 type:complete len:194 (+) Transcript_2616:792-1373(+)
MGKLFRELNRQAKTRGLANEFTVCFEATHHGPYLETPAMFMEIGSAASEWSKECAGECWADTIENTILQPENEKSSQRVVLSVGGGHYVAFMRDLVLANEDITPGHMLPSYLLDDVMKGEKEWAEAIAEAIDATRRACEPAEHAEAKICVYVDKKSFKSEARRAVVGELEARGIEYTMNKKDLNNKRVPASSS